jgi:hypothetical protein
MRKPTRYAKNTALSAAMFLLFSLFSICWAQTAQNDLELKKACLKAVMQSIDMEIKRMQVKLNAAQNGPGDPANVPVFKSRIEELKAERKKYLKMDPAAYTLPEKKILVVNNSQPLKKGSLLGGLDMSRSGPFYHIAGIKNDNYSALKPGSKYTLTLYLVYPRDYFFPSFYVYVYAF